MSLSHMRPLQFGEILDGAFTLYRRHFATLFTTALLPYLPLAVLWGIFGVVARADTPEQTETVRTLATVASYPIMLVVGLLVWGALTYQTSQALQGHEVDRGAAFGVAVRRLLPLLGAALLSFLLIGFGLLLLVVPAALVAIMLFAALQVVVLENRGPVEALARSRELARGAWGRIFGIWFIVMMIVWIPSMVVGGVAGAFAVFTAFTTGGLEEMVMPLWITAVTNVLSILISALTTPFYVGAMTLLYYDRRVRTDALDLELATERLSAVP